MHRTKYYLVHRVQRGFSSRMKNPNSCRDRKNSCFGLIFRNQKNKTNVDASRKYVYRRRWKRFGSEMRTRPGSNATAAALLLFFHRMHKA